MVHVQAGSIWFHR